MLVGVRVGPGSPAVLLVVGRGRWVPGWPYCLAAPVAHRRVSSKVLVPYCTSFLREGELGSLGRLCLALWCVGLRVTLNGEVCTVDTSVAFRAGGRTWKLDITFTSPLYLAVPVRCLGVLFWRNGWFNSGFMSCVSSWRFCKVVFVKVSSTPEVDSRPALLGPRSLEKCAQFLLQVAWAATL